jgi:hypothetical protein
VNFILGGKLEKTSGEEQRARQGSNAREDKEDFADSAEDILNDLAGGGLGRETISTGHALKQAWAPGDGPKNIAAPRTSNLRRVHWISASCASDEITSTN